MIQNISDKIFILFLGHVDFGALGVPRGSKNYFFKHGHVAYQIDGDDKQNRIQVNFLS